MSSIIEDAVLNLACTVHNVCVDSRSRDIASYPDPWSYVIPLTDTLQNVLDIELTYAQYSLIDAPTPGPDYIILSIDECTPNNFAATTPALVDAFTTLPMRLSTNSHFEYTRDMYRSIKRFAVPKAKLSRLTISFSMSNGRPLTSLGDHMLRFEVRSAPTIVANATGNRQLQEDLVRVLPKLNRRLRALEASLAVSMQRATTQKMESSNGSAITPVPNDKSYIVARSAATFAALAAASYAGYRYMRHRWKLDG